MRGSLPALALLLAACEPTEPADPSSPSQASPAAMMERTVVEPALQLAAEPHLEPSKPAAAPKPTPSEAPSAYDRKAWPHWIDADRDCQDTRTEVLIRESFVPVTFEDERRCELATGRWQCPYTGNIIAAAHLLDIDHLVPLANAHRSGAATWTPEQRRRYANDLEHPEHLVAVEYTANRSKGDRGPEAWLPPLEDARCGYVRDWVKVKQRWRLSMNDAEAVAVATALELCDAGQVPASPQAKPKSPPSAKPPPKERANAECCRVCSKGKACGDGCIAKTSTCSKPPGCACDG